MRHMTESISRILNSFPRNDSGGGYSDKVNASVMAGGLPDVLTGPEHFGLCCNGIIQPLAVITLVTIPVIIIYSLFSKQIVEGVTSTGSKEG